MLTKRQEKILNTLIEEHVKTAKPVSSKDLEKKCKLGVCPATIRIDLQKLTDLGYIEQPYTSAGRVPTTKGYRVFVDNLLKGNNSSLNDVSFKQDQDEFKFADNLIKELASVSSGFVFTYLFKKDFILKQGFTEVFNNPEFREPEFVDDFFNTVSFLEENMDNLIEAVSDKASVFIGKPFLNSEDFSLIASKTRFPEEEGLLAILGPKRMEYNKNINLINSVIKEMQQL